MPRVLTIERLAIPFRAAATICLFITAASTVTGAEEPPERLTAPVTRELPAGVCHAYKIEMAAGQYLRVRLSKGDLSIVMKVFEPGGQKAVEFSGRDYGSVEIPLLAGTRGEHRLEICSLEAEQLTGRYTLEAEAARAARARDRQEYAAELFFNEGETLRARWEEASLRAAAAKYMEAARLWHAMANERRVAAAWSRIGAINFTFGEFAQAADAYARAERSCRKAWDESCRTAALLNVGYVRIYTGESRRALEMFERAYAFFSAGRSEEERRGKAQSLNHMGESYYALGDLKKSLEMLGRALEVWAEVNDQRGRALTHLNLGYSYADAGEPQKALEHFEQALALWRAVGDVRGQAMTNSAVGVVRSVLGENQAALHSHTRAMEQFRQIGDRRGEAAVLNSIGQAYVDLNDPRAGLDHFNAALEINRKIGNRTAIAVTMYYLGFAHRMLGDTTQALEYYEQSARLSRQLGKRRIEGYALIDLGTVYATQGEKGRALGLFQQVLDLCREIGDRRGQAYALNSIGFIHFTASDWEKALKFHAQALPLARAAGDRSGEASTLYNMARAARTGGRLAEALKQIEAAVEIIESVRSKVGSEELRLSYFAAVHEYYRLYISVLMGLDRQEPASGHATAALQVSERARARTLLETLNEAGAEIRQGCPPELLEREHTLKRLLRARAEYQLRLLNSGQTEEAEPVSEELHRLASQYHEVEAQIREQSPGYAALTQPQFVSIRDVQAELRGEDTLLLEYALGDEESYLWAVSPDTVESYRLPGAAALEGAAREVYGLLTARQPRASESFEDYNRRVAEAESLYAARAGELSRVLLGPVASIIGQRRLLIVADGAVQYVPFEALPSPFAAPSGERLPLALTHEVAYLPSGSTIVALRHTKSRPPAAQMDLAVLADPVFEADDPRVLPPVGATHESVAESASSEPGRLALRDVRALGEGGGIPRLPSTLREAEAIMSMTAPGRATLSLGFEASRETALSRELARYRIVHFATHGIINSEHPELSGLVLSMVNERGEHEDGFLQLHDIYNLNLTADLVVLSACRTGLGKDVRGEGMVGLTRGFMYAGAKGIIASLWKVDDSATAELMTHFYRALLRDGKTPLAALRAAKEAMWKQERWRSPFYWGAFVLQGDYRAEAEARHRPQTFVPTVVLVVAAAFVAAFAMLRMRRRRAVHPNEGKE